MFEARNGNIQVEFNYAMDVLPGTCTNEVAIDSPGTITVSIIGTNLDSDVNLIDASTLALEGVAPIFSNIADISSPVQTDSNGNPLPGDANCSGGNASDGVNDLVLIFPIPAISSAIGPVSNGALVGLTLTGALTNGTPLQLDDIITILSDTTPPVLTAPLDITVEASGPLTSVVIGTATATDLVDGSITPTSNAPAAYPLGATVVTWTACDVAGNCSTASQNINVVDTTAPALTVPGPVSVEATGPATIVALGSATATDLVDGVIAVSNDAPATFPVATTVVNYSVTDVAGNTSTGTQNVTVVDTTAPTLTVPGPVSVEATGPATTVALGSATATDLVDGVIAVSNDAPATFPVGTTVVNYSVTDVAGNTSTGTQDVTVVDTTAPTLTAPGNITAPATGVLTIVDLGSYVALDAVGVETVTNDAPVAGFPVDSTTTVTWTACDAAGNCTPATQTVTVLPFDLGISVGKTKLKIHHGDDDKDKDKDHDRGPKDWLQVAGTLTEFSNGDGLNFLTDAVTIVLGNLSWNLPAGSFVLDDGEYEYKGGHTGLTEFEVEDNGKFKMKVKRMDLSGLPFATPIPFSVTIGNDFGQTTVTFNTRRGKDDDDKGKDKDHDKREKKEKRD